MGNDLSTNMRRRGWKPFIFTSGVAMSLPPPHILFHSSRVSCSTSSGASNDAAVRSLVTLFQQSAIICTISRVNQCGLCRTDGPHSKDCTRRLTLAFCRLFRGHCLRRKRLLISYNLRVSPSHSLCWVLDELYLPHKC